MLAFRFEGIREDDCTVIELRELFVLPESSERLSSRRHRSENRGDRRSPDAAKRNPGLLEEGSRITALRASIRATLLFLLPQG